MRKAICSLFVLCSLWPAWAGQMKPAPGPARWFDYDAKQPLDVRQARVLERDGCKVVDLTYASPKGGRVPAFLVVPEGKGPFAGIVFGHWGGGNRTEFLPEAKLYAQAGVVSVLIDYPWVRPAPWRRNVENFSRPEEDRDAYIQAVVDLRRAIDLLLARPDVDPRRIGYVGHSYGAQWGAILAAVDKRMKAAVLVGGTPSAAAILLENDDPGLTEFRKNLPQGPLEQYIEVIRPLDAIQYVPHAAPIPLLFQLARFERFFNEAAMNRYFQAASLPKVILWYDTGHDLNDVQTLLDRAAWLEKQMGTKSLSLILQKKLQAKSD